MTLSLVITKSLLSGGLPYGLPLGALTVWVVQ